MTFRHSTVLLLGMAALATTLAGCQGMQTQQDSGSTTDTASDNSSSSIHLQLHSPSHSPGPMDDTVTLVANGETLEKAIRAAYPDAPIVADGGIQLDQRISVWTENLTPARYLEYLGSQVNADIRYTSREEVEVRSVAHWELTLPRDQAGELMPQVVRIAQENNVKPIVLGDADNIMLLSGKPDRLDQVRRAMEKLNARITLEKNLDASGVGS